MVIYHKKNIKTSTTQVEVLTKALQEKELTLPSTSCEKAFIAEAKEKLETAIVQPKVSVTKE